MTRRNLQDALVKSAILFGVSVALILAFWFHSEFYQVGLLTLVIIGGLAVFGVFMLLRMTISPLPLLGGREAGRLELERGEADSVLKGSVTAVIRPVEEGGTFPADSVCGAWVAGSEERLGRLRVRDARRVLLHDVTEADAERAGYGDVAGLFRVWKDRGLDTDADSTALIVRFAPVEGRA